MNPTTYLLDPTAPSQIEIPRDPRALNALKGKVVSFIDNAKPKFNLGYTGLTISSVPRPVLARPRWNVSPLPP